jgi:hypothetical protein
MEASTTAKPYSDWRDAVNKSLHQVYCITIEDAGFDEGYLLDRWQSNEAPFDFIKWLGNKYDLDPIAPVVSPLKRSS